MTIIDLPVTPKHFVEYFQMAFDLDREELWISADSLPRDCMCKAGLTTMAMLRRNNKLYLPLDWCINEWAGPKHVIDVLKDRRQREFACLDEYQERYEPSHVETVEPQPIAESGACDEHPSGSEELNLCSTGSDGACSDIP